MNPEDAWFTKIVVSSLKNDSLKDMYLKHMKLCNYAVVAGFGVIINTVLLYLLIEIFPLFIANWIAIAIAWASNYTFSVGPLGYLFGLGEKK
jgi:hypothetical protein